MTAVPDLSVADTRVVTPRIPITPPPPPPPDEPPSVTIEQPTGRIVAGVPTLLTVEAFPGAHWVWSPVDGVYNDHPIVSYAQTEVDFDNVSIRDHTGGGSTNQVTFATPGDHTVQAFCTTTTGQIVSATPISVHVVAAVPPAFTVQPPAEGSAVALSEGGAQIPVGVNIIPAGQPFPMTVGLAWDGQTSSDSTSVTTFAKTISLAPMPLGPRTIAVTVADHDGVGSTKTVTVNGQDAAPPHVVIEFPAPQSNAVADAAGKAVVPMSGSATDSQSGMVGGASAVAWALSPTGTRTPAQAVSGDDFSKWHADVPLTGFGAHTIYVWATDQAGNTMAAPTTVAVEVISSFTPSTLDERLSEREYLAALLSFAQEQVSTVVGPPAVPVDTATLIEVLGQPLDRLSQPLSATADRGGKEINQLRVPVELLRARIGATHAAPDPGAAGEANYRTAAYAALLAAAGTSYAELRLARGATDQIRQALAARLGVRLSATRPDELDQLVLDGPALTEAALETMFGLPDTTVADVLRVPATPTLVTWQLAGLVQMWAEQDQHPNPPRAFNALVDPDVIGDADIAPVPNSDPVRALLAARTKQLADYVAMLDGIRTGAADPAAALSALLARALPGVDLAALETSDGQGVDIAADLAAAGLTRTGFTYLRTLGRLAAAGPVTAAEWGDALDVLTAAHKQTALYADWRAQETAIVLSPDFFVLADNLIDRPGPAVSPLRVDGRARTDWQSVLRARIAQRQDVTDASAAAVAEAEQAALPVLRDALLADLAPGITGDVGEEMSALFLVDVLAGGTLRTTRIRQAIESVQSLLAAKRAGELTAGHPAFGWSIGDTFAAAWVWMGELGTWQAATMAFLFPERQLDPTLLVPSPEANPPAPLNVLYDNARGSGEFSAATANQLAAQYVAGMKITPSFTYLDPHRSPRHQDDLRAISAAKGDPLAKEMFWAVPMLLAQRLQSAGDFQSALDWYWLLYPYDLDKHVSIYDRIDTETAFQPDLTFPPGWTAMLDPFALVTGRPFPYTRATLLSIIRCHLDYADSEFTRETDESIANARTLYLTALRLLGHPAFVPQQPKNPGEPALPIPELDTLRNRAQVQLAKLRQGRNIAGMPRSLGVVTGVTVSQPTPYRFKVLMDRAKQLTAQAAQMEAGYLSALEKYDDRNLRLFDALKAIDLNAAQVTLSTSRVKEANDAVTAAVAQKTKADTMASTYGDLIASPPNKYETDLLNEYPQMRDVRNDIVEEDMAITVAQAAADASSIWGEITSFGMQGASDIGVAVAAGLKFVSQQSQNNLEAQMQANQLQAGIEQRRQEWRVQQISAQQDSLVAAAQVTTAGDQVTIAVQEQAVASLQYDQAVATLKFLDNQFTNADLYLWMSTTLGGVYRFFLQQATATARLAQAQLAFERAEPAQTLIRGDYWQSPAELTSGGSATNRRGLTGAEQLSQDLARLDDHAFSSERRRLNLSQTFSLARLMPVEFLDFRRTGSLSFATPMALFDADFPGHYLRLIRQVRTSVVALVPVDRGIRATLSSNGVSRVTTQQDGAFGSIVVRHDPTVVALTSPINASGVFELDSQSDLLLPFESSGVDTTWELALPRAANPFDYATIVDVMVTIDYTALSDDNYRSQLTAKMNANRDRGADVVFSLSRDFPDQWYDLNNPADPAHRSVTLPLRDVDFPIGIDAPTVGALAVRLVIDQPVPDTVVTLTQGAVGGDATVTGGIAGTRRGNASAWMGLVGRGPVGDWQLRFGSDAAALFGSGQLTDVLLVVSWTGQAPAWT